MRHKIMAWFFLALYLSASLRSVFPLVQDCLAHTLFWSHHLVHVHHGHEHSDHVAHELHAVLTVDDAATDDDHHHATIPFQKDTLSAHLISGGALHISPPEADVARLAHVWTAPPPAHWFAGVISPPPDC